MVVLDFWGSDHRAILLQPVPNRRKNNKMKSSRFEPLWVKHVECSRIVEDFWKTLQLDGSPSRLVSGLTSCAGTLRRWGSRTFGNIPKRVARLQQSVEALHKGPRDGDSMVRIQEVEKEFDKVLGWEEEYWRQRSRVEWLKNGDRNTKFFYYKASSGRKKSEILGLEDREGHWREDDKEIKDVVCNYFWEIFSSSNPQVSDVEVVLNCIDGKINRTISDFLLSPYLVEDIRRAVFSLGPSKAPGPDGFHAIFF